MTHYDTRPGPTQGTRLTDCCGSYSTVSEGFLVCKSCHKTVPFGQGDGGERWRGHRIPDGSRYNPMTDPDFIERIQGHRVGAWKLYFESFMGTLFWAQDGENDLSLWATPNWEVTDDEDDLIAVAVDLAGDFMDDTPLPGAVRWTGDADLNAAAYLLAMKPVLTGEGAAKIEAWLAAGCEPVTPKKTVTGRLKNAPALQNIPIRTPSGRRIREAFPSLLPPNRDKMVRPLERALRAIIAARDTLAEGGEPPYDPNNQGFDDWAADLAQSALKKAGLEAGL